VTTSLNKSSKALKKTTKKLQNLPVLNKPKTS
jgi:hypothetical protein